LNSAAGHNLCSAATRTRKNLRVSIVFELKIAYVEFQIGYPVDNVLRFFRIEMSPDG
jgi:hypothetical protein